MLLRSITLALLLGVAALPAFANDTTAELRTSGLTFTNTDTVTMEEEQLFVSPKQVRVDYVFRNTSDKPVETYVAFPMPDIVGSPESNVDAGDTESDNFLGFSVEQDGQPIQPALQQRVYVAGIDMTDIVTAAKVPLNPLNKNARQALGNLPQETIDEWLQRGLILADIYDDGSGNKKEYVPFWTLKSTYYWKTTFPAGQAVKVAHKYRPSVGGTVATTYLDDNQPKGERYDEYKKKYCIDDTFVRLAQKSNADMNAGKPYLVENWISYVLVTANNWFGPISKFTLTVDKGEADNFVSFCGKDVKKIGPTTFQMTATDFSPEQDLEILLLVPTGAP